MKATLSNNDDFTVVSLNALKVKANIKITSIVLHAIHGEEVHVQ